MPTISLTLPISGTVITAGLHSANYSALQSLLNAGLDSSNWASGKIFAPSKLTQESATAGQYMEWNGTTWVPFTVPLARVSHNATQATTSNVGLALAFNTESVDTDTIHDTVTANSRLTCKTAGRYQVTATSVTWANNPVNASITFFKNGSPSGDFQQFVGDWRTMGLTALIDLAVNDYVECVVTQITGSPLNVNANPVFAMARVG